MANLEPPGQDLITLHVYSPPPSCWNYFTLDVTTLADHDRLLREGAETVVVDFGQDVRCALESGSARSRSVALRSDAGPVIAIVGGGFSGAMVAVHLARLAGPKPPARRPLREDGTPGTRNRLRHAMRSALAQRTGRIDECPARRADALP